MQVSDMTSVAELYGLPSFANEPWNGIVDRQQCPFLKRKCLKNRKSEAHLTIGTCTMMYGRNPKPVIICPHRMLERKQIFSDCVHLLSLHEPGNELRIIAELTVPGGSIDYCLVSVRDNKPRDFVGIELQTLDTTGTVWPERQRFVEQHGVTVKPDDVASNKSFGMNWKMTAKTILVQLNHKIETFEHLSKRLVLVMQDCLLSYMRREFAFDHINGVREGDPMQFHSYELLREKTNYKLSLKERISTDSVGIGKCLGLQVSGKVELQQILRQIQERLPRSALLTVDGEPIPVPSTLEDISDDES